MSKENKGTYIIKVALSNRHLLSSNYATASSLELLEALLIKSDNIIEIYRLLEVISKLLRRSKYGQFPRKA